MQSLTTWDGGNQLTYPVKYHDIGYKEDLIPKEKEAEETGFQVHSSKDSGLDTFDLAQKDDSSTADWRL